MMPSNNVGISGTIAAGLEAYKQGSEKMQRASQELSQHTSNGSGQTASINRAALDTISADLQAQSGAKVISRSNDMLGSIIDTFA